MRRPLHAPFLVMLTTSKSLVVTLVRQNLGISLGLVAILLLLAALFSFLAFSPVLSPFVYPLF